jgi:hypothetical protein
MIWLKYWSIGFKQQVLTLKKSSFSHITYKIYMIGVDEEIAVSIIM